MSRTSVEDPLKVFNFLVEIDGMTRAGFMECTGLEQSTEVAEYREGGDNNTTKKSPGLTSYSNITLRRGQILDEGQNDFINAAQRIHATGVIGGTAREFRQAIDIVQFEKGGTEAARWRLDNAWACRVKFFGDLNAMSSDNSVQEIEYTHEGCSLVV